MPCTLPSPPPLPCHASKHRHLAGAVEGGPRAHAPCPCSLPHSAACTHAFEWVDATLACLPSLLCSPRGCTRGPGVAFARAHPPVVRGWLGWVDGGVGQTRCCRWLAQKHLPLPSSYACAGPFPLIHSISLDQSPFSLTLPIIQFNQAGHNPIPPVHANHIVACRCPTRRGRTSTATAGRPSRRPCPLPPPASWFPPPPLLLLLLLRRPRLRCFTPKSWGRPWSYSTIWW